MGLPSILVTRIGIDFYSQCVNYEDSTTVHRQRIIYPNYKYVMNCVIYFSH
jgi:hypothetical protein